MSNDIVISVKNLSKKYNLYTSSMHRLKEALHPFRKKYHSEFYALEDVSFEVSRGETVGIIGRNGSGKSTLLKIITGVQAPTKGSVELEGNVSALLELGAGFNPDFTGIENVYFNGSIMGYSKAQMESKMDDILAFADIGEYVHQPMKTYSSGMFVRLAFAVASFVDPEVLIIDEALAVGDVKFQAKCFRRFDELISQGTSILFVTHSTEQVVRHCNRAILMENGRILMQGEPKEVTNRYMDLLFGVEPSSDESSKDALAIAAGHSADESIFLRKSLDSFENRPGYNSDEYRWGSRDAEIVDFGLTTDGITHSNYIKTGQELILVFWVDFKKPVQFPIFGITIKTPDGVTVFGCNSRDCDESLIVRPINENSRFRVIFRLRNQNLGTGDYFISLGVAKDESGEIIPLDRRYDSIHVKVSNESSRSFGLADFSLQVELEQV